MDWVDSTVQEFGEAVGLPGLAFNENGVVSLDMDSLGVLQIERSGSRVTLCLARPLPQHDDQVCRAALAQCHYRDMGAYPVSAGLRNNDTLVFLVHVPERAFSIPELEHCFDALVRAHDAATAQPG